MASNEETKPQQVSTEESTSEPQVPTTDFLASLLQSASLQDKEKPEQVLDEVSFDGIAKYIKKGKVKNIVVMAGAGISTSAGIPDFRSPGSGLYDNLAKYNLPDPTAIFELGYFKEHPEPFFQLAKELWPGIFKPTPCHYFLRLLHEKKMLLRHYTQNIDTLERVAKLDGEVIVEAHGTFHTSHCLNCKKEFSQDWMKEQVFKDSVPKCDEKECEGLVKPDIIFFGEALPERFFKCAQSDLAKCDLLLVMGTSLVVQPFASLANRVPDTCPRLYINLEKSAGGDPIMAMLGYGHGFQFDSEDNYRDVFHQSTCDDGCMALAEKLDFDKELKALIKAEHDKIDAEQVKDNKNGSPSPKKSDEKGASKV